MDQCYVYGSMQCMVSMACSSLGCLFVCLLFLLTSAGLVVIVLVTPEGGSGDSGRELKRWMICISKQ